MVESPIHAGAASSRYLLTARQRSKVSHSSSSPASTRASDTCWWATMVMRRSGASVADAKESMADASRGRSMPPMPARSMASRSRSGPWGRGGGGPRDARGEGESAGGPAVIAVGDALAAGEVVSYGDVAAQAGFPGAARGVGAVLAGPDSDGLPWWRVVTSTGRPVPGHEVEHTRRLRAEGVEVVDGRVRRP